MGGGTGVLVGAGAEVLVGATTGGSVGCGVDVLVGGTAEVLVGSGVAVLVGESPGVLVVGVACALVGAGAGVCPPFGLPGRVGSPGVIGVLLAFGDSGESALSLVAGCVVVLLVCGWEGASGGTAVSDTVGNSSETVNGAGVAVGNGVLVSLVLLGGRLFVGTDGITCSIWPTTAVTW